MHTMAAPGAEARMAVDSRTQTEFGSVATYQMTTQARDIVVTNSHHSKFWWRHGGVTVQFV